MLVITHLNKLFYYANNVFLLGFGVINSMSNWLPVVVVAVLEQGVVEVVVEPVDER